MAQFFQPGQKTPSPLLLPSRGELEQPYLQHDVALQRTRADQAMAALQEQGANQRQQASLGSALQLAQMQQATAQRGQDLQAQQAMSDVYLQQQKLKLLQEQTRKDAEKQDFEIQKYINSMIIEQNTKAQQESAKMALAESIKNKDYEGALANAFAVSPDEGMKMLSAQNSIRKIALDENKSLMSSLPVLISSIKDEESYQRFKQNMEPVLGIKMPDNKDDNYLYGLQLGANPQLAARQQAQQQKIVTTSLDNQQNIKKSIITSQNMYEDALTLNNLGLLGGGYWGDFKRWKTSSFSQEGKQALERLNTGILQKAQAILNAQSGTKTDLDQKIAMEQVGSAQLEPAALFALIQQMTERDKLDYQYEQIKSKYASSGNINALESSPEMKELNMKYEALGKQMLQTVGMSPQQVDRKKKEAYINSQQGGR